MYMYYVPLKSQTIYLGAHVIYNKVTFKLFREEESTKSNIVSHYMPICTLPLAYHVIALWIPISIHSVEYSSWCVTIAKGLRGICFHASFWENRLALFHQPISVYHTPHTPRSITLSADTRKNIETQMF